MDDTEMPIVWRMESDDLARAKDVMQTILQDWDFMSWNVLLAEDVVLSPKLGGRRSWRGQRKLAGLRPRRKPNVLKSIYRNLKSRTSVTTQVVSGYDVALLGNLVIPTTKENEDDRSLPPVLYMAFNPEGEIDKLTIAAVDLQPLTEAVRIAARTGAFQPP
jgi:hypothetical protein